MCGFGGAGAFSDGKYNFTTAFGGWLTDFMPEQEVMELIDYVDCDQHRPRGHHARCFSTEHPRGPGPARKRPWNMTSTSSRPGASTWAPRTTCGFSPIIYEDLRRDKSTFQLQHRRSPPSRQADGGYRLEHSERGRSGSGQVPHRRPRPLRRGVVCPASASQLGLPHDQQPGGHRRAGGAARH